MPEGNNAISGQVNSLRIILCVVIIVRNAKEMVEFSSNGG